MKPKNRFMQQVGQPAASKKRAGRKVAGKALALLCSACLCLCGIPSAAFAAGADARAASASTSTATSSSSAPAASSSTSSAAEVTTTSDGEPMTLATETTGNVVYVDPDGNTLSSSTDAAWQVTYSVISETVDRTTTYHAQINQVVTVDHTTTEFICPTQVATGDRTYGTINFTETLGSTGYQNFVFGSSADTYATQKLITSATFPDGFTSIGSYTFGGQGASGNPAGYYCQALKSVDIPSTVETIGDFAFSECPIESIEFPESLTELGRYAFYNCTALDKIDLSGTQVTEVPDYCFRGCSSATSIDFSNTPLSTIGTYGFSGCTKAETLEVSDALETLGNYSLGGSSASTALTSLTSLDLSQTQITAFPSYTFEFDSSLAEIQIPEKQIVDLGDHTFYYCESLASFDFDCLSDECTEIGASCFQYTALTSLSLPDSITSLGNSAFNSCTSLSSPIDLSQSSITSIGDSCFRNCTQLSDITLPDDLEELGTYMFYSCTSLTSIDLSNTCLTTIPDYTFAYSAISDVTFPDTVTSFGAYVFSYCAELEEFNFSNTQVAELGNRCFSYCTSLKSITFGQNITTIGTYEFVGCSALESLDFSATKITEIPDYTFQNCDYLSSVLLSPETTSIGSYAFDGCSGLTSFAFIEGLENLTSIGTYAFRNMTNENLTSIDLAKTQIDKIPNYCFDGCTYLASAALPTTCASVGSYSFRNTGLVKVDFLPGQDNSVSSYAFYGCSKLTEVEIPDIYTKVNDYAFAYCTALPDVDFLPETCTQIGNYVFQGCTSLKTLDGLPDACASIGAGAFYDCTGLTSASLPSGCESLSASVFQNCTGLKTVDFGAEWMTSIGASAFSGCTSLETVEIPPILRTSTSDYAIGDAAFHNCESLKSVVFKAGYGSLENYFGSTTNSSGGGMGPQTPTYSNSTFEGCEDLESVVFLGTFEGWDSAFQNMTTGSEYYIADATCYSTIGLYNTEEDAQSAVTATRIVDDASGIEYTFYGDASEASALISAEMEARVVDVLEGDESLLWDGSDAIPALGAGMGWVAYSLDSSEEAAETEPTWVSCAGDTTMKEVTGNSGYAIPGISLGNLNYATVDTSKLPTSITSGESLDLSALVVTAYDGETVLREGTSYTIVITDSTGKTISAITDVGTYTLTIEGVGSCEGTSLTTTVKLDKVLANTEEIDSFEASIKDAQAALDGVQVSSDGSDVSGSSTWVTQATYDALANAIASAQNALAGFGADTDASEVAAAQTTLSDALSAFNKAIKVGTKKASAPGGGNSAKKQTIKAKGKAKVKSGKKVTIKVKNAKTKLAFKANKKVKKALKIKVKGKKKLIIKTTKKAKKGKTYKIKVYAKASGVYAKSNVKTIKVKVK